MHLQHFWSLAVEEQFYLVWPFLVLALSRRGMMRACVAGFALAIVARYALTPYFPGPVERLMPGRLDALAAGSWVALALRGTVDVERARVRALLVLRWSAAALGVVLLTTTLQLTTRRAELESLAIALGAVVFAATIATVVLSGDGRCARAFSRRTPRFLGRYSYALYVVHQPLILLLLHPTMFQRPVDGGASRMPMYGELLVATAALSVSVALVSWHGLEKHFLRMKERVASSPARD
jgi:peptidoglycan/LPS O-acetylase OafA/YrhL